jgi:hypothetical protein
VLYDHPADDDIGRATEVVAMWGWLVASAVLLVMVLAPWIGVDSRDGRDWQQLRPGGPLR